MQSRELLALKLARLYQFDTEPAPTNGLKETTLDKRQSRYSHKERTDGLFCRGIGHKIDAVLGTLVRFRNGARKEAHLMQKDVLFIHGWWAADWVWSRVADRFEAAGYRAHAVTLPGPDSERSSFHDNLQVALETARLIGNPILVGHSVGGLLAMKMTETIEPPACIAMTPAPLAGVLPRPSLLLVQFLMAALPSMLFGRDFMPRALLRRIDLNLLPPAEQDDVLARMRPVRPHRCAGSSLR